MLDAFCRRMISFKRGCLHLPGEAVVGPLVSSIRGVDGSDEGAIDAKERTPYARKRQQMKQNA